MKNAILAIAMMSTAISACATQIDNTLYITKAAQVLSNTEYKTVKITGQIQGFCTIAQSEFDFNAASFVATTKDNKKIKGAVCGNKIYY